MCRCSHLIYDFQSIFIDTYWVGLPGAGGYFWYILNSCYNFSLWKAVGRYMTLIVVLWFGSQDGSEGRIFQGRRRSGCHTRISLVGVEEEVCSRYQNKVSVCFAIKDEGNSSMWSISFQKLSSSGLKFCQNPIPLHNYPASFHPF